MITADSVVHDSPLNFSVEDDYPIRIACTNGFLDIVKYLIDTKKVNFQAENNEGFRLACENGHLEVAKWLYYNGTRLNAPMANRIYAYDDYAFRKAFKNGHYNIVNWLKSIANGGIRESYLEISQSLYNNDVKKNNNKLS